MENKKSKRFYRVGEVVWVIGDKKKGKIISIDKDKLEAVVEIDNDTAIIERTLKLWRIDKLKYSAKKELIKDIKKEKKKNNKKLPIVYFSKLNEQAIIPSKRDEDAGYDIYASIEGRGVEGGTIYEMFLPKLTTTLVPTGIAMALPNTHYFNCKHERGSTGKISMSVLAGVVDSGYRGEIFIAITPLDKDVLITSDVKEVKEHGGVIFYPYSKAIAQGTIELVPQVEIQEIPYEELQKIKSERGTTNLGQSGK